MIIWLVGAGPMAFSYAQVLRYLDVPFRVVGRTEENARRLAAEFEVDYSYGGIATALSKWGSPDRAIVSVPVDQLERVSTELIGGGCKSLLVEKPAGLDLAAVQRLAQCCTEAQATCFVGYNRRFLPSVREAQRRIKAAGGALSLQFDFTENVPRVADLDTAPVIKTYWAMANSSHVIDLAYFLCGLPEELVTTVEGSLPWHASGAAFFGGGRTSEGTSFTYASDWRGPGRWGIEIVLPRERLVLRPLETLQHMPLGRFELEVITVELEPKGLKPGLLGQTSVFLSDQNCETALPTVADHAAGTAAIVSQIAGYGA